MLLQIIHDSCDIIFDAKSTSVIENVAAFTDSRLNLGRYALEISPFACDIGLFLWHTPTASSLGNDAVRPNL